ncbi:MAG: 4Fe-4S dicluster domain-containing protein [Deltaproteobacteria bacterium]|nr:4Fe-4S dicluster domain-containing protein [Deltaproteobacteria bacterium]MBW2153297.1 4Fe-4S dicluster domain-containing protein [Deltaproteobacteria bacterium]
MTEKQYKKSISRRTFLKTSTLIVTGSAIAYGAVSVPLLRSDRLLLRPPGALDEDVFLASCIKCGQCLQVCPPQVVKLAGISQGFGIGTPYIVPRQGGCILCSGLPCVLACLTGALDHNLSLG